MTDQNKATVELAMPLGVQSFKEYQTIAQEQAAAMLNCKPTDIDLEFPQQIKISSALKVTARPAGTVVAAQIKRATLWRWMAIAMCLLTGVILAAGWLQGQTLANQRQALDSEIAGLSTKILQLKKPAEATPEKSAPPNPLAKAKVMVQLDMNPVFKAIEGIKVPNAKLKQLTLETNSRAVQVTYELNQATQVAQITEALNLGATSFEWKLKNMTERQAQWVGRF